MVSRTRPSIATANAISPTTSVVDSSHPSCFTGDGMTDSLTLDDFAQLRERELTLKFGDEGQSARILEAREVPGGMPGGRTPFSIILRSGSRDRFWPQGIYRLCHPEHGELELFLVPIGPDDEGMRYEISFS